MYRLAREIRSRGETVVTSTTTKIFRPDKHESPCVIFQEDDPQLESLRSSLAEYGHVTVAQSFDAGRRKLIGVDDEILDRCSLLAQRVVVEADGAAGRSIKAPEEWEPVIPRAPDLVIPIVGLDCIGLPATAHTVFRLERFGEVTGVHEGRTITAEAVGRLLSHPHGGLKGVPGGVAVTPLLNKLDQLKDPGTIEEIALVAETYAKERIERIVAGSLRHWRPSPVMPH